MASGARYVGVFDGVSALPASRDYARRVSDSVQRSLAREDDDDAAWKGQAARVLQAAVREASTVNGATTACLLRLDTERAQLSTYVLGDAGFLVFRPPADGQTQRVLDARASPQRHRDGSPFQLIGGANSRFSDLPSAGMASTHPLSPGTVVVLHTDGLLDNMPLDEVCAVVERDGPRGADTLAKTLAYTARSRRVRPDDVTVVVVTVASSGQKSVRGGSRARMARASAATTLSARGRRDVLMASTSSAVAMIAAALLSPGQAAFALPTPPATVSVLELIKIFGKLAGRECFGQAAPQGASCQLSLEAAKLLLGLGDDASTIAGDPPRALTESEFVSLLSQRPFAWPLKPWGAANSASNAKTAVMNKSVETGVYMEELIRRGLLDPRNPAGPLPTSLRPQLSKMVGSEEVDEQAAAIAFRGLLGAEGGQPEALTHPALTAERLERTYLEATGGSPLDYYSFQALVSRYARPVWPAPGTSPQ